MRKRARDRAIRHRPHDHVRALRHQADEVPEGVVRAGGLRIAAVGLHLHGMDEIGELDRVLDEEHRDVVADEIPVAFLGVELDGEAAHVARRVHRAGPARHRREAHEHLRLLADLGQHLGARVLRRATRSARKSRAPPSRVRARCALGFARGRNAGSSRAGSKSSSRVGPRRPAFSEFWLSLIGMPWLVVSRSLGSDAVW